jgi:regulator of sigma E protease
VILWTLLLAYGVQEPTNRVDRVTAEPAYQDLRAGDRILSVDGVKGDFQRLRQQISSHKCPGTPTTGCQAATWATIAVDRGGKDVTVRVKPVYNAAEDDMFVGFVAGTTPVNVGPVDAAHRSVDEMWFFTHRTVETIANIFNTEQRKQISGVVGTYEVTRQTFELSAERAIFLLAIISLSLGVINLFPFLPLDGGHIFWALAEKVRGRAIPFSVMERAGFIGFVLVIALFMVGFTNDIGRLTGEGFGVR